MDQQRVQVYVELIEQLMSCPDGQEFAILQANQELVDLELLQVIEAVIDQMQKQGQDTSAQWLENLAMQLAEAMGLTSNAQPVSRAAYQDSFQFFFETLQIMQQNCYAIDPIYQFLGSNQSQLNTDLLHALPEAASFLLSDLPSDEQMYAAAVIGNFGSLMHHCPLGQRAINTELAIAAYKQALQVISHEVMPIEWVTYMNNLANAYRERLWGDQAQNIEKAIDSYKKSLQIMTRESMSTDWATSMMLLANAYVDRIQGDRGQNIEEAISTYKQSLQVRTREAMPVEWAASMNNLGTAYYERIWEDRAQNIENAIDIYEQVLHVRTREVMPIEWAQTMDNLALAYAARIRGNRAQNLEKAIDAHEQALQVLTYETMPMDWARTMNNLALTYTNRIQGDRAQNLEKAIDAYKQALQITTFEERPLEWADSIHNLAGAYFNRIRGERAQNLEQAIDAYKQALQVRTRETMPVEWAYSMNNLGIAYANRIQGDRAQNIEDAIDTYQQLLQVRTRKAMPIEWAQTMRNLAGAYTERIRGTRAQNIEEAIDACEQALLVITRETMPLQWAQTMNNLAGAYAARIHENRAQNIENALTACKQALEVITREVMPVDWATSMSNLAKAYISRIRGDRVKNIEDALIACKQALEVITRESMPIDWATLMMTRANAYAQRIQGDRAQNIEEAIDAYQQVLEVRTRKAMPIDWAQAMHNLAAVYAQHIQGDRAQNIENAIATYQQALQVTTREAIPIKWAQSMNNLASAYLERILGDRAQNIEDAIDAYQQALQVTTRRAMPIEWAQSMNNLASAYLDRILGNRAQNIEDAIDAYQQALTILKPNVLPNDCRRTARFLGDLYGDNKRWTEAITPYEMALEAVEILYQASLSLSSQETELAETNDLFRRAAYAQARAGRLETAVVTAEIGRARGLSQVLERERADLTALETTAPDLYQQYQQAVNSLRQLEVEERSISPLTAKNPEPLSQAQLRNRAETIHQTLRNAISAIRQHSGYENFLEKPTFEDIVATVQSEQPLVYLLPTPNGGVALIVHQTQLEKDRPGPVEVSSIWLDTLTDTFLQELLFGPGDELEGWFGAYDNQTADRNAWFQAIDQTTHQLWTLVMEPVVTHLKSLNIAQAILIPAGFLSFFPLHAAWVEDSDTSTGRRYALDDINFTYTPNARSLQAARTIREKTTTFSLLAINEPWSTKASPLPSSEHEIEVAVDYFQESHRVLKHEQATREEVLAALPNYDVLHFSCHGYVNPKSLLDSGLLMAEDEILSLRDFFNANLQGVRLAILSACETGLPGAKLPDEVISLPTGLLQAGVAGVAASLWQVSDLSTMMLLVRFYDYWQNNKLTPAQALHNAQKWVRDTSNGEKEAYFKGMIPELAGTRMPHSAASVLYQSVAFADPDANDVAHPFYWAAFTYIGI